MTFPMSEWRRGLRSRRRPRSSPPFAGPSQDPSAANWSPCLRAGTKSKPSRPTSRNPARFFSVIERPRRTSSSFRSANTTSFTSLFTDMSIPNSRIAPRSSLRLRSRPVNDGLLQVREIRDLRLNADLVTLSACDTGVGPVGEEGVENIVNAFHRGGRAERCVDALGTRRSCNRPTDGRLLRAPRPQRGKGRGAETSATRHAQLRRAAVLSGPASNSTANRTAFSSVDTRTDIASRSNR